MPQVSRMLSLCGVLLCLVGCGPHPVHHVQSELLLDGSIERAILQPNSSVFDEKQWDHVRRETGQAYDRYEGDLTVDDIPGDTPVDRQVANVPKVFARKRLQPNDEIPPHVEFRRESLDAASTLKLERSVQDFGFVTDCTWTETLTEVVDVADAVRARREFVTLFVDQCERAFKRWFEPEYDSVELVRWLRTDGEVLLEGLFQIVVFRDRTKSEQRQDEALHAALWKVFADHGRRYGIEIPPIDPKSNDFEKTPPEVTEAFEKLLARIVSQHLQRRDGQPVDDAAIRKLFFAKDQETQEKLDAQWNAAKAEYPGGEDAYQAAEQKLAARIFGIHGGLFGSPDPFRCTVKLPGVIVESNGVLLSERVVQWKFLARAAYPHGYTMHARSIAVWDAQLPGLQPDWSKDRRNWIKLVELAARDRQLAEAMRECRAVRSLYPLEKLLTPSESDLQRHAREVLRILSTGKKKTARRAGSHGRGGMFVFNH